MIKRKRPLFRRLTVRDFTWLLLVGAAWWGGFRHYREENKRFENLISTLDSLQEACIEEGFTVTTDQEGPGSIGIWPSTVHGAAYLNQRLLKSGEIRLTSPKGWFVGGPIADGKYEIRHVPRGEYKVTFHGEGVPDAMTKVEETPHSLSVEQGRLFLFEINWSPDAEPLRTSK